MVTIIRFSGLLIATGMMEPLGHVLSADVPPTMSRLVDTTEPEPTKSGAPLTKEKEATKGVRLVISSPIIQQTLVRILPGTFTMGDPSYLPPESKRRRLTEALGAGSSNHQFDAGPLRKTTITKTYFIGETKVTAAEYCVFLNAAVTPSLFIQLNEWSVITEEGGKYTPKPGLEDVAVNTVPWEGAEAYCKWLSKELGLEFRLPTEAEWEFAARGVEGRLYSWGNDERVQGGHHTGPFHVRKSPQFATPEGAQDMVGSTAEWCQDWYAESYDPKDMTDPQGPKSGGSKVMRARKALATDREDQPNRLSGVKGGFYGFRVVMTGSPPPRP